MGNEFDIPVDDAQVKFNEISSKYKNLFFSQYGMDVLSDILFECHFGCMLNHLNPQEIGEYNIGVAILIKCGILAEDTRRRVIMSLVNYVPTGAKEVKK